MRLRISALLSLAACLAAPTSISAQTIQQQPAPPPTIQVYSRETLVDVTVTDAKGQPIHGLKQSDFTVTEDGKQQSIRSFHEFSKDTLSATPTPPKLPPNVYTNLELNTGPLNVLLFDGINNGDIIPGRWDPAKFIKSMAPGTRVALLGLGDNFTVLRSPTSAPALLLNAVNNPIKPYRVEVDGRVDPCAIPVFKAWRTLEELGQLASYLSGIKGKKNVIWIGTNSEIVFNKCQDWRLPLQQTYDLLGDAQVTVYPLDPNGVGPLGGPQLAMEAIAESTGGVAYYENNDLKSLMAKAVDLGSSYYSISYVPPGLAYDGKFHAIGIKVNRPNVNLVYRKGYSAEDPTQLVKPPATLLGFKMSDSKPAGLAPDRLGVAISPIAPPTTQLLFEVRVEPTTQPPGPTDPPVIGQLDPTLKKSPLTRYDMLYMLPQSQIAFAAADGGTYSGSLEFDTAAFDPDGKLVTIRSQTMKLPLTNEEC
jgi:VWFA-related protein